MVPLTVPDASSICEIVPSALLATQTCPSGTGAKAQGSPPTGTVETTELVAGLIMATALTRFSATYTIPPGPYAAAHGTPGTGMVCTTLFVAVSMTEVVFEPLQAT
jgi:hypothetical protein